MISAKMVLYAAAAVMAVWAIAFASQGMPAAGQLQVAAASQTPAPAKPGETPKMQTKCPVTGNPINRDIFVDVDGYRIYACCPGCPAKIKADPKAAIAKIRANGEEPQKIPAVQAKCPITGQPINRSIFVDVDGYRIYACCPGCPPKIKADPKAAIEKIRANGEEPEKIPAKTP